jgi:hypothetical protein
LGNNDRLLRANPALGLDSHGVVWYLLNQLEFLNSMVRRELQEVLDAHYALGPEFYNDLEPAEEINLDWVLLRFQEALLSQVEFDVTGQFRLRLRQPLTDLLPAYYGLVVLSNVPINGMPSLLTTFGTNPDFLAVLVVVLERLAKNFRREANFSIGVADQFLKFQRENLDTRLSIDEISTHSWEILAFNFECAPMGFPLTLEEIGYRDPVYNRHHSLFFDHLFVVNAAGKITARDNYHYPYDLVSRLPGSENLNLLIPYATIIENDLLRFTTFLGHIGELFYGPRFLGRRDEMRRRKLVPDPENG